MLDEADERIEQIYVQLGERVRAARMEAGWTQEDLSGQVRLTRTSIANIEAGRQRVLLHQVFLLADALSIPVSDLMGTVVVRPTSDRTAVMAADREVRRLRVALGQIAARAQGVLGKE